MSIFNITFSPTGGTKKVADILSAALDSDVIDVDLCEKTYDSTFIHFNTNDICLFAVPSFGGRVPLTAINRIKHMTGKGARVIAVVVYGNREQEDTLFELCDTLKSVNFNIIAGVEAIAEHSVIRKFAANRPDAKDRAELLEISAKIADKLENMTVVENINIPGNTPYKDRGNNGMKPAANENCTKCGICSEKCPVGAISADDPSSLGNDNCISCMRCISVCPSNARKLDSKLEAFLTEKLSAVCSERKTNKVYL